MRGLRGRPRISLTGVPLTFASGRTLLQGYALFFIGAGLLGVPALILCAVLARVQRDTRGG